MVAIAITLQVLPAMQGFDTMTDRHGAYPSCLVRDQGRWQEDHIPNAMIIMLRRTVHFLLFPIMLSACSPERPPGLPEKPREQAAYEEQLPAWTCLDVRGRTYAITTQGASQATDTLFLVGDRIESAAQYKLGFMAASFTCNEEGNTLRVTSEMMGRAGGVLQWNITISGDLIDGEATWINAGQPSITSAFEGASIAMEPRLLSPPKAGSGS